MKRLLEKEIRAEDGQEVIKLYLDGELIFGVIAAGPGWIERVMRNSAGWPIEASPGGFWKVERLEGKVEIDYPEARDL